MSKLSRLKNFIVRLFKKVAKQPQEVQVELERVSWAIGIAMAFAPKHFQDELQEAKDFVMFIDAVCDVMAKE